MTTTNIDAFALPAAFEAKHVYVPLSFFSGFRIFRRLPTERIRYERPSIFFHVTRGLGKPEALQACLNTHELDAGKITLDVDTDAFGGTVGIETQRELHYLQKSNSSLLTVA